MTVIRQGLMVPAVALSLMLLVGCDDRPEQVSGFAGLAETVDTGADGETFLQPGPGDRLQFPRDWGEHPRHRIEWWYLTANLRTGNGDPLGLQWTQFRQGLVPRAPESVPDAELWPLESAWMAHGAVSFNARHWFAERFARGDVGNAGAQAEPLAVWLDHWQLQERQDGLWELVVEQPDWGYRLTLEPSGTLIAHGDQGFSTKSASGEGSMYFSDTDIRISGEVRIGEHTHTVEGLGWLDREWSSQFLRADQRGWDWFALRLESGARLMAFRLRESNGSFRSGTWVAEDGTVIPLDNDDLIIEPVRHRSTDLGRVPVGWRLVVRPLGEELQLDAPAGDYWNAGLYPYWESPVQVTGDDRGEGYMELTGYADTR